MWKVLLLALFAGAMSLPVPAAAQTAGETASASSGKGKRSKAKRGGRKKAPRPRRSQAPPVATVPRPPASADQAAPVSDEPERLGVAGEGSDKKPRVYTFGGLDVEGKLKTPQLLYFRSRVKQELDTSSGQKRSFLKELEQTADIKGL